MGWVFFGKKVLGPNIFELIHHVRKITWGIPGIIEFG